MVDFYLQNAEIINAIAYVIIGVAIALYIFKDTEKDNGDEFDSSMFNIVVTFVAMLWPFALLFVAGVKFKDFVQKLINTD